MGDRTRTEGTIDEAKGNLKQGTADAQDTIEDAGRNLTDR